MDQNNPSSSRTDRKTIERNRRNQLKALFSTLNSLVLPHPTTKEATSLPDQLEEATNYIKKLQTSLEKLKEKKKGLMRTDMNITLRDRSNHPSTGTSMEGSRSAQVKIQEIGSALDVVLVTGLVDYQFMFTETIRVLQEEGADIVNAIFSIVEVTAFHTIHCNIEELLRVSGSTTRISERLNKFVLDANAV